MRAIVGFALCFLTSLGSAAPKKNIIFYVEDKPEGGCRAVLHDVDGDTSRVFFDHELICPAEMKWDASAKLLYYQVEEKLYSLPWTKKAAATLVASFDHAKVHPNGGIQAGGFWFSADTGNLRFSYLAPLTKFTKREVNGIEEYEVEFEGKTTRTQRFLGIGSPYMAIAMELRKGSWVRLAAEPTTAEACDTLGDSVLSKFAKESPTVVKIRTKRSCDLACRNAHFPAAQQKALALRLGGSFELYFDQAGNAVLASEGEGDTVHTGPPVRFCKDKECKSFATITGELHSQLYIAPSNGWVLIGYEYDSTPKTFLFKFPEVTPKKVFATARAAAWFPYDELWESLK